MWRAVAAVFTVGNFGGAVMAIVMGETAHAAGHVALMFVGAYLVMRLTSSSSTQAAVAPLADGQLEQLQQSVDAIAVELERIGEAQRFSLKLEQERSAVQP
jgi:hypothetical protein